MDKRYALLVLKPRTESISKIPIERKVEEIHKCAHLNCINVCGSECSIYLRGPYKEWWSRSIYIIHRFLNFEFQQL